MKLVKVVNNKKKDLNKGKSGGIIGFVVSLFSSSEVTKIQTFVQTTSEYKSVTTDISRLKDIISKWKKVLDGYDGEVDNEYEEASDFIE